MRQVCFFHSAPAADIAALRAVPLAEASCRLWDRQGAWILQTFLRLRDAGFPVVLDNAFKPDDVVVFGTGRGQTQPVEALLARGVQPWILVAVRADGPPSLLADFEIVQNQCFSDEKRIYFVQHWPQPDLIGRDASRGLTLQTVSYKGHPNNLHPGFKSDEWLGFLESRRLTWDVPAADGPFHAQWRDYRRTDIVVGLREGSARRHRNKPASKLANAWLAGSVAMLGPEPAYRQLRLSPLDYVEIRSVDDAIRWTDTFLSDRHLYQMYLERAAARASEVALTRVEERWQSLLFDQIPAAARRTGNRRRLPPGLSKVFAFLRANPRSQVVRSWLARLRR